MFLYSSFSSCLFRGRPEATRLRISGFFAISEGFVVWPSTKLSNCSILCVPAGSPPSTRILGFVLFAGISQLLPRDPGSVVNTFKWALYTHQALPKCDFRRGLGRALSSWFRIWIVERTAIATCLNAFSRDYCPFTEHYIAADSSSQSGRPATSPVCPLYGNLTAPGSTKTRTNRFLQ